MDVQDSRGYTCVTKNVVRMIQERQIKSELTRSFQSYAHMTDRMIETLQQTKELHGHKGCVNCLDWNEDGSLLLSGSDDTKVILWDPLKKKRLSIMGTRHIGNIFSVKFLPRTGSSLAVTGAGDTFITVINVERSKSSDGLEPPIFHCRCHGGRVKRIATSPDTGDMFWSAGEDGLVLQFDLREPHYCPGNSSGDDKTNSSAVIVDLFRHAGWQAEVKCVAINPVRPHILAVGGSDGYARLYDRRFLKLTPFQSNIHSRTLPTCFAQLSVHDDSIPTSSAQYFAPGHLSSLPGQYGGDYTPEQHYKLAATYVTFSPDGNEMLVNLGGDHIYLYDINTESKYAKRLARPSDAGRTWLTNGFVQKSCCSAEFNISVSVKDLDFSEESGDPKTPLLSSRPHCACQYTKRADAFMKRKWLGDYYAAARDYLTALELISHRKPLIGLIYALIRLKWWSASDKWLKILKEYHTSQAEYVIKHLEDTLVKERKESRVDDMYLCNSNKISKQEEEWRKLAWDYKSRYTGHCNTTTDIKEAVFLGSAGRYIAAGSDDGVLFIWNRETTGLMKAVAADSSIVNCVQPHPLVCLIATSGIENVIKLWEPRIDDSVDSPEQSPDMWEWTQANQKRIAMDPFETMLANMGYQGDVANHRFPTDIAVCRAS